MLRLFASDCETLVPRMSRRSFGTFRRFFGSVIAVRSSVRRVSRPTSRETAKRPRTGKGLALERTSERPEIVVADDRRDLCDRNAPANEEILRALDSGALDVYPKCQAGLTMEQLTEVVRVEAREPRQVLEPQVGRNVFADVSAHFTNRRVENRGVFHQVEWRVRRIVLRRRWARHADDTTGSHV